MNNFPEWDGQPRVDQRVSEAALRLAATTDRIGVRHVWQYLCRNWPYLLLFFFIAVPMYWIAAALTIRSKLYSPFEGMPSSGQVSIFQTFIGGGLATAATLFGALLTRSHNRREHRRLQLQAVLESLKSLPEKEIKGRMSGVFPAMVMLGQQNVALRALDEAVTKDFLSMDTVVWVIDEILNSGYKLSRFGGDSDFIDTGVADEAASLLHKYAENGLLTQIQPPEVWFPSYFFKGNWNRTMTFYSKDFTLRASAHTLLSREWEWWREAVDGQLPNFPTRTWIECAKRDFEPTIRSAAAILLDALITCFPEAPGATKEKVQLRNAAEKVIAKRKRRLADVPHEYHDLVNKIRYEWK
ncbi:hypothetical protein [Streptosporangium amethystogenes]|uniref:hypothetical protein n=1 Tax=Streptosporangium amethystogenes TaxID=2002 RepID=UPI0012FA702B|nr:hypothetical protein [Streptosporangium amethystogenes]